MIEENEKKELNSLTKEIGSFFVANNTIDFLYDDFMSVFRKSEFYNKEYLSFDEIKNRREEIQKIVQQFYGDEQ